MTLINLLMKIDQEDRSWDIVKDVGVSIGNH